MSTEIRYRIAPYTYGLMIQKRQVSKEGVVSWHAYKYPDSLERACDLLLELVVRDKCEHNDIRDVIQLQRAVQRSVGIVRRIAKQYADGTKQPRRVA